MSRSCLGAAQTNSCTRWGYAMRPSPAAPCAVCEHTLPHSLSPGHCPGHTSAAWACWSSPTPQTRAANRCMPLTNPDNCCRNHSSRGTSSNSSTCTSTASSTSRPDLQSQEQTASSAPQAAPKCQHGHPRSTYHVFQSQRPTKAASMLWRMPVYTASKQQSALPSFRRPRRPQHRYGHPWCISHSTSINPSNKPQTINKHSATL